MKRFICLSLLIPLLGLSACETTLNEPATGALLGGGAGAGLGAIIGSQTGHAGVGTAIGAGAGALLGALAGEAARRNRERTKEEIRQEFATQQGYYGQTQKYPTTTYPTTQPASPVVHEVHTKFNPRTGKTFPERYQYDPETGDELQYIR